MSNHIIASVDLRTDGMEARSDGGPSITMAPDAAGGPTPVDVLLASLAGCTAMDVVSILRKKRQSATSYEIEVRGDRSEEHPRVFTSIRVDHRVRGGVEPEALRRSIELSATTYCPVSAMLSAVARIEHRYHLVDDAGVEHAAVVAVLGPGERRPPA
jgi:putative redox protein